MVPSREHRSGKHQTYAFHAYFPWLALRISDHSVDKALHGRVNNSVVFFLRASRWRSIGPRHSGRNALFLD